jgi:hypothetical protein
MLRRSKPGGGPGCSIEIGRPACYVVAGLAQLGRIEEAKAALEELNLLNSNLAFVEGNLRWLYNDPAAAEHILEWLRAVGMD